MLKVIKLTEKDIAYNVILREQKKMQDLGISNMPMKTTLNIMAKQYDQFNIGNIPITRILKNKSKIKVGGETLNIK